MPEKYIPSQEKAVSTDPKSVLEVLEQSLPKEDLLTLNNLKGAIEAKIEEVTQVADSKYLKYLQEKKSKVEAQITVKERSANLKGITKVEFDDKNMKLLEEFIKSGKQILVQDTKGNNYFIAHGKTQADPKTGESSHVVDVDFEQKDTISYLKEQIISGKFPKGNLNIASCHVGEISQIEFDKLAQEARLYGINLQRVTREEGVISVATLLPEERLKDFKVKSQPKNNIVYFQPGTVQMV
ncbi:MAG: hypothetical protein AAGF07_01825 [Patescibacteria group bacterium]